MVCLANNRIYNNYAGLAITSIYGTLVVGNHFEINTYGLYFPSWGSIQDCFFLNTFSGNAMDFSGKGPTVTTLSSPVKMHFNAGERAVKAVLGNYYAGWPATDANGDGIADSPRTSGDGYVIDPAPLMVDYFANPGNASLDWFGGTGVTAGPLFLRNASSVEGSITLANHASAVFSSVDDTGAGRVYRGGRAEAGDGFSGWLRTTSALPDRGVLALVLGHTAVDGSDFQPAGPAGEIVGGNNRASVYPFALSGPTARIPAGRRLAVKVTNRTGEDATILTGLGWLGLSASLPPVSLAPAYLGLLDDPEITY